MRVSVGVMVAGVLLAGMAVAQDAPVPEVTETEKNIVTVHPYDFLKEDELKTLRLVATVPEALALFVPQGEGFAALAVSPQEGFVRDGVPVASAIAVAELPDAVQARDQAMAQCDAAKKRRKPCVVILEISPRPDAESVTN